MKAIKDGKNIDNKRGLATTKIVRTPDFVESVRSEIEADKRVTITQLMLRLSASRRTIWLVLNNDLGMSKKLDRRFNFHWDNAPVHTACIIMDFLAIEEMVEVLSHPPYSPDMAPVTSSYPPR